MVKTVNVFKRVGSKKLMKLEDDFEKFCEAIKNKFKAKDIKIYKANGAEIDSESFCCISDEEDLYFIEEEVEAIKQEEIIEIKELNQAQQRFYRAVLECMDKSRPLLSTEEKKKLIELIANRVAPHDLHETATEDCAVMEAGMLFQKDLMSNSEGIDATDASDSDGVAEDLKRKIIEEFEKMISEKVRPLESYEMTGEKRGIFLIFNCVKYQNGDLTRKTAEKDEEHFRGIAESLGFREDEVEYHVDKKAKDIEKIIAETCKRFDESEMDCLVCCVGSHGSEGDTISIYNKETRTTDDVDFHFFVHPFAECSGLKNKPKLFILQACRGGKYEKWSKSGGTQAEAGETTVEGESGFLAKSLSANFPHVVLACSTIPEHRSTRMHYGSVYVKTLKRVLDENPGREFCELLTMANGRVANMGPFHGDGGRRWKQMACFRTNLTKNLYFPLERSPPPPTNSPPTPARPKTPPTTSFGQPEVYSSDEEN